MSLMLWPVRPKKHPSYPHVAKLRTAPAEVRIAVIGTGHLQSVHPVTAAPAAVLCARLLDNVSHARRDAHDFAFATLVSRIR